MSDKPDTPHPEEDPTLHRNPASGVRCCCECTYKMMLTDLSNSKHGIVHGPVVTDLLA